MSEVSKEDLNRLHERVDAVVKNLGETNVRLATVATRLESLPAPLERPCNGLQQLRTTVQTHLNAEEAVTQSWKMALIQGFVKVLITAIIAGAGFLLGMFINGG